MKKILVSLLATAMSSCVFLPTSSGEQDYYLECDMGTKRLSLEVVGDGFACLDLDENEGLGDCLVVQGIVVSGSAIVSGSIVLIGNTLHWLEYKVSC